MLVKGDGASARDLYIGEAGKPTPKQGEVLVKASSYIYGNAARADVEQQQIKAFGLNRMDIMQRKGGYPLPPGASTILGVEFSGTIEQSATDKWKHGDEVFGLAFGGAYAEYIAVAEGMITRKPKELNWEQAA